LKCAFLLDDHCFAIRYTPGKSTGALFRDGRTHLFSEQFKAMEVAVIEID
jgi:hypothetical protein